MKESDSAPMLSVPSSTYGQPPSEADIVKAAADRVREAAAKAKAEGRLGGTTKPAGPESPEASAKQPQQLPIPMVMGMLQQLLQNLGETVDRCDSHFMQDPLYHQGSTTVRRLLEDEVLLLRKRAHAVVVVHQVRNAADVLLQACGPGPRPFPG